MKENSTIAYICYSDGKKVALFKLVSCADIISIQCIATVQFLYHCINTSRASATSSV